MTSKSMPGGIYTPPMPLFRQQIWD
jgi:hypothetical protein